jgi:hypothetical protein
LVPYLSRFVVKVAICEHKVDVIETFFAAPIIVVFHAFFNRAQVHGLLDNFEIIRQPKLDRIDRGVKWPAMLMFPHSWNEKKQTSLK